MYDNAGTDIFGGNTNPETFPTLLGGVQPYRAQYTTPLQYVQFNGCFHDTDGKWKVALHFPLSDRAAMGDDPDFYVGTIVRDLVNYPADVLAQWQVANADATKPAANYLLETVPLGPIVLAATGPTITSPNAASITLAVGLKVLIPLQSDTANTKWALGGTDAASFEIAVVAGGYVVRVKNDAGLPVGNYQLAAVAINPLTGLSMTTPFALASSSRLLIDAFDYVGDVTAGPHANTTGGWAYDANVLHSNGNGTATFPVAGAGVHAVGHDCQSASHFVQFTLVDAGHRFPVFMGFMGGGIGLILTLPPAMALSSERTLARMMHALFSSVQATCCASSRILSLAL